VTKDMTSPNWTRTYKRIQRNIAEIRELGCQVIEPPDFDKPPAQRVAPANDRPV